MHILTKEQQDIIRKIVQLKKPVQRLGGFAGCGKTTLVRHLVEILPNFSVCAYTGKAADVLRQKGIEKASTIHRLIYTIEKDEWGHPILDNYGCPVFILAPSLSCDGVIIDEASMVSEEIHQDLVSFNIPLIYVGDHGQLEPVGDSFNLMENPDYLLEQIHRNAGEIAYFAEFVRKGYRPDAFQWRFRCNKVKFLNRSQVKAHLEEISRFNPIESQVICAYNKTRVEINNQIRSIKGHTGNWPEEGEKVMCLKNNSTRGLFNGMQGVVKKRYKKPKNRMALAYGEDVLDVTFDPSQFGKVKYDFEFSRENPDPFDFSYGITCHKSMGSEWDHVMVFEQRCELWEHKRWAYTAASRAKDSVAWVSE